jgi:hypothetical protein
MVRPRLSGKPMRLMYCWRCRKEVPMLAEDEFSQMEELYLRATRTIKERIRTIPWNYRFRSKKNNTCPYLRRIDDSLAGLKQSALTICYIIASRFMGRLAQHARNHFGRRKPSYAQLVVLRSEGLRTLAKPISREPMSIGIQCGSSTGHHHAHRDGTRETRMGSTTQRATTPPGPTAAPGARG